MLVIGFIIIIIIIIIVVKWWWYHCSAKSIFFSHRSVASVPLVLGYLTMFTDSWGFVLFMVLFVKGIRFNWLHFLVQPFHFMYMIQWFWCEQPLQQKGKTCTDNNAEISE